MTTPTAPSPTGDVPNVVVGVIEAQNASDRLGDGWKLRFATITETATSGALIYGRFDGDTQGQVPLISLVGLLAVGGRCAVVSVPPSGNYVVGYAVPPTVHDVDTGNVTTTSATYVSAGVGALITQVSFVAAATGRALVHFRATFSGSDVTTGGMAAIEVTQGGSVIQAASDNYAVQSLLGQQDGHGTSTLLTGLTPGLTYNIELKYRRVTGSGTLFIGQREIVVAPAT